MSRTWADDLAEACESALHLDEHHTGCLSHPAYAYLKDRLSTAAMGVSYSATLPGVGLGVPLPDGVPQPFRDWAARHQWGSSVVFPIREFLGQTVAFVIRHATEKTYLRFEVYDGASTPMLWNADRAFPSIWRHQHVVVTEGLFDALAVRSAGCPHVVATLGANPTTLNLRWLKRLATRVTVLTDMDAAGRSAAQKYRDRLAPGVIVSTPEFGAHDVWDLWVTRPDALRGLVC